MGRPIAERAGTTLPKHALHGLQSLGEMMVAAWKGDFRRTSFGSHRSSQSVRWMMSSRRPVSTLHCSRIT